MPKIIIDLIDINKLWLPKGVKLLLETVVFILLLVAIIGL
jgi:hypothetical protein